MVIVFRGVYILAAIIGLVVTVDAWARARWVYRELCEQRINGLRQMIAAHSRRQARILVIVQASLLVPALVGLALPRSILSPEARAYAGWFALAQSAHIVAVVSLMVMALLNRSGREAQLHAEQAEARTRDRGAL